MIQDFFLLKVWRFKYNDRKNHRRAILHMIPGFWCISYISLENFLIGWHIKYACLITRLEKIYINSFLSNIFQNYGLWGKKGKLFSIFKIMVLKQCFWKGSVFCDFCSWIFWELLQKKNYWKRSFILGPIFFFKIAHRLYKLTK